MTSSEPFEAPAHPPYPDFLAPRPAEGDDVVAVALEPGDPVLPPDAARTFDTGSAWSAYAFPDGDAAIVGADLNTWSVGFLESAVETLRERFPDGPPFAAPTMTVGGIPRQLDHLLFRLPDGWRASLLRVDDRYGSDHHPVLGVLTVGG